jgi:hypothetical protein
MKSNSMQVLLRISQKTRRASMRASIGSGASPLASLCRGPGQDRKRVLDTRKRAAANTYQVKPTC